MIERVEGFGAELQFDTLGHVELLDQAEIEVPVGRGAEDVPAGAIRARSGERKRARAVEYHRADYPRGVVVVDIGRRANYIGARDVRVVVRTNAAIYAEGLAGHVGVDTVDAPT